MVNISVANGQAANFIAYIFKKRFDNFVYISAYPDTTSTHGGTTPSWVLVVSGSAEIN